MKKTSVRLALSGFAVVAGLTLSVGPVWAGGSATAAGAGAASGAARASDDHDNVLGYFQTSGLCEKQRRVSDPSGSTTRCELLSDGPQVGWWALKQNGVTGGHDSSDPGGFFVGCGTVSDEGAADVGCDKNQGNSRGDDDGDCDRPGDHRGDCRHRDRDCDGDRHRHHHRHHGCRDWNCDDARHRHGCGTTATFRRGRAAAWTCTAP